MTRTTPLFLAVVLALAAGCRGPASVQTVPMPDAAVEVPAEGHARVYVVRRDQTFWSRWPLRVYVGENELATLAPGAFLCWEAPAGRLLARLVLDRPRREGGPQERLYDVTLEPGAVNWTEVSIDPQSAVPAPQRLEPDAGRALVAKSVPAAVR